MVWVWTTSWWRWKERNCRWVTAAPGFLPRRFLTPVWTYRENPGTHRRLLPLFGWKTCARAMIILPVLICWLYQETNFMSVIFSLQIIPVLGINFVSFR